MGTDPPRSHRQPRNASPVGWYVASYLQRFAYVERGEEAEGDRFTVWENTVLIQASDPNEAYEKAMRLAKDDSQPYKNVDGDMVDVVFEGFSSLLPIYDELEDGAEIIWRRYEDMPLRKIHEWAAPKDQLEVFRDSEEDPESNNAAGG